MKKGLVIFSVLLMLCLAVGVYGKLDENKFREGDSLLIDVPVNDNLYVFAGDAQIKNEVKGDLVSFGGSLKIEGSVTEDVIASGGEIFITGPVGEDVRSAGGKIYIENVVSGDVNIAGGEVKISSAGIIGKDAIISAGTVVVDGEIKGDLYARGAQVTINGVVGGDLDVSAGDLTLGPQARINGNLIIEGKQPVDESKIQGEVIRESKIIPHKEGEKKGIVGFLWYQLLFGVKLFLVGAVLIFLTRGFTKRTVHNMRKHFWRSVLVGFMMLLLVPVVSVLLLVTVIGIPLGILMLLLYGIGIFLTLVFGAMMLGRCLFDKVFKSKVNVFLEFAIGALLFVALEWIPYVGGLIVFVFLLVGFGAMPYALFGKECCEEEVMVDKKKSKPSIKALRGGVNNVSKKQKKQKAVKKVKKKKTSTKKKK